MLTIAFLRAEEFTFNAATRELISSSLGEAESAVRELLPLPHHINVTVYPSKDVLPETGDFGAAATDDWIQWWVNPWDSRGLDAIVGARLRPTFFHEAHHLARRRLGARGEHLIDWVVFEGLATAFERDATANSPPWGGYDESDVTSWIGDLLAEQPNASRDKWVMGYKGQRHVGYLVGTYIADRAIRASGQSAADLAGTAASEVLRLAGFS
jgi:uncharacterized protein YjaZ